LSLLVVFEYLATANLDLRSSVAFFVVVYLLLIASYALGFIGLICIVIPILQPTWSRLEAKTN
jgi:TRAP-type mannitol/chloroaromatic compound transport system permease large subunit